MSNDTYDEALHLEKLSNLSINIDTIYKVPTGTIVLLSFLYGTVSLLSVLGNTLVIWIITTSKRMHNVTNMYIANLAMADITIGIFAIPFQFQAALLQRWNLPEFMCPFCPFIQALSVNLSVFTLTAIAIDRHRAILDPFSSRTSKRKAKYIILCIWIVATTLAIPMALAWTVDIINIYDPILDQVYNKPLCEPSEFGMYSLHIYRIFLFVFQYSIPVCIISCAYIKMAVVLWGTKIPGNAQCARDENILKNKKKVIKMLVIVVALFVLCWMPLQLYYVIQTFIPDINEYTYINIIFFCFDWLAMSNACYNPFIYGIYNEKFKREFKERLHNICMGILPTKYKENIKGKVWYYSPYAKYSSDRRKSSRSTYLTNTLHTDVHHRDSIQLVTTGDRPHSGYVVIATTNRRSSDVTDHFL